MGRGRVGANQRIIRRDESSTSNHYYICIDALAQPHEFRVSSCVCLLLWDASAIFDHWNFEVMYSCDDKLRAQKKVNFL